MQDAGLPKYGEDDLLKYRQEDQLEKAKHYLLTSNC
ncbi:hypothetical protein C8N40_104230 [Pontibacter mucosus]|uniref:Uncharacterized protein n=1 Tax=Pontibacter mucosus TaxID=1649266 RepID=A0A2T5YJK5_9BACT|nr:hypothetical protein C8N40_104230 [Pontibacter mucosus]